MSLEQFLEQQTKAHNALVVSVHTCQSVAVADVESSEREVKLHRRIVEITEGRCKHADSMKWHETARWQLILLQLRRADEIAFYHFSDFSVAREAEHDLIDDIFEHKVLVVVGCCQLNVFEHEFVNDEIRAEHVLL